jgi:hypothetical protein
MSDGRYKISVEDGTANTKPDCDARQLRVRLVVGAYVIHNYVAAFLFLCQCLRRCGGVVLLLPASFFALAGVPFVPVQRGERPRGALLWGGGGRLLKLTTTTMTAAAIVSTAALTTTTTTAAATTIIPLS